MPLWAQMMLCLVLDHLLDHPLTYLLTIPLAHLPTPWTPLPVLHLHHQVIY